MSYQQRYWLEKLQVQVAGVASLVLAFFVLAPLLEGPDPEAPLTFLPFGGAGRGLVFAACLVGLAGLCSVVTVSSRPQGALVASLLGAAGMALRSGQMRMLFWQRQDAMGQAYFQMILELIALGGVVILAAAVVGMVRWAWFRIRPGWLWQPWKVSSAEAPRGTALAVIDPTDLLAARFGGAKSHSPGRKQSTEGELAASLPGALLGLVLSLALVFVMMRSAQRLQILFALVASFGLAVMIADRVFPIKCGFLPLLMPIVAGVLMYVLASSSSIAQLPQAWVRVGFYGRALPMDWVTAGCGGAMLGYWASKRSRDARDTPELA